jgi:hypothetical protein
MVRIVPERMQTEKWQSISHHLENGPKNERVYVRTCFSGASCCGIIHKSLRRGRGKSAWRFLPDLGASPCRWPFSCNIYVSSAISTRVVVDGNSVKIKFARNRTVVYFPSASSRKEDAHIKKAAPILILN